MCPNVLVSPELYYNCVRLTNLSSFKLKRTCKYATDDIDKFWRAKGTTKDMAVDRKELTVPPSRCSDAVLYCLIGTVPSFF